MLAGSLSLDSAYLPKHESEILISGPHPGDQTQCLVLNVLNKAPCHLATPWPRKREIPVGFSRTNLQTVRLSGLAEPCLCLAPHH